MQIILNLPDELLKQLLNIPDPERFAQQAIVTALCSFVEAKETAALDYGDEDIDPAEAFNRMTVNMGSQIKSIKT